MWNIYLYFIILKLFTNFQNINFFCQNRSSLRYIANKKILIYIYRWNKTAWWWSFTICIFYQWHMDWWHFIKPDINIQQLPIHKLSCWSCGIRTLHHIRTPGSQRDCLCRYMWSRSRRQVLNWKKNRLVSLYHRID